MSTATSVPASRKVWSGRKIVLIVVGLGVLIAMGLDTKVVRQGEGPAGPKQFSQAAYGKKEFPKVRTRISERAAPATQLAAALAKDKSAAVKKYGVPNDIGPIMSVKFSGVVGKGDEGVFNIKVPGLPQDLTIRLQTGPAIIGTTLRDGAGGIRFGDFENQIQYQNAAAGINNAMKKQVLSGLDRDHLTGKTVHVVGAFQLINPHNWLVTPVELKVGS
ncbi:DUF2291 family protein [Salinisphaera sp. RV14]|uniref:DUF2291 family protein n=1 Tax=unclassified Salinisphaera TaxID=2649847 RepID=UPI003F8537DF